MTCIDASVSAASTGSHQGRGGWLLLGALALGVGLTIASGIAVAQSASEVRLGHNRAWGNPGLLVGLTKGHFDAAGVKVVEKSFNNPADIVQAIATGDLDAGVASSGVLFTAVQNGVKVKAVAVAQGGHNPAISYMVRSDSNVETVQDLKGKTAAIAGFGGTADLYLRYWVTQAGLDPKADLNIAFVPFHLTLNALVGGQVDIGTIDSTFQALAEQKYPGQLKPLFTYEDVSGKALGNNNTNALLLVFGDAFVQRARPLAVAFLQGYLRAIQEIHADPKRAVETWAEASKIEIVRMLDAPPTLPNNGKVYVDAFRFEADLAFKFGYLKEPLDVESALDLSLIEEAGRSL